MFALTLTTRVPSLSHNRRDDAQIRGGIISGVTGGILARAATSGDLVITGLLSPYNPVCVPVLRQPGEHTVTAQLCAGSVRA